MKKQINCKGPKMSFHSEEQWEIIDYCKHCGAALWAMGAHTRWNSLYCDTKWNGHEVEEKDDIEEGD